MCNCRFCCKGENFAYFVVNESENDSRILIRSGGGKSLIIISENYYEALAKVQTDYLLEPKDTFFE